MIFDVTDFPKFVSYAGENFPNSLLMSDSLIAAGYKSTKFRSYGSWYMDDEEYTWFVLRWS
jgi:hypothetical protein